LPGVLEAQAGAFKPKGRLAEKWGKIMTLSAPATILTAAVTILAVLILLAFAIGVSRTRRRVNIPPPAMTGAPELERSLRIHGNTVEQIIIFLPALWLAALYFQGWVPPIIGLVWCLGRILYALGYSKAANARLPGFALTIFPTLILIVLAIIGVVNAWIAVNAV
jgi:glutathione S-transferase